MPQEPDRPPLPVTPLPSTPSDLGDQKSLQATLQTIALLIGLVASALTPLVWISSDNPREMLAPALIAMTGWAALMTLRRGYARYMPHVMVFSVMTAAFIAVMSYGSVRTAGSFLFVAVVTGAGTFLGRRALVVTVVASIAVLGGLTIAERLGWMHPPELRVGLTVWLTHSATLVVVAIMVFYSRSRTREAMQRLTGELELRRRTEHERDQSLERFTRMFRNSPSPMIAQSGRSGVIMDVNPAFERCYGYPREQVLGRVDEFLWAQPAQREGYLRQLMTHRSAYQVACEGQRADGSTFDALVSSEMGNHEHDTLTISTIADVSVQTQALDRLQRSEERFAKAFRLSPLNLTITRLSDGMIIEVNRSGEISPGLSDHILRGRTTVEVGAWLRPEDRQAFVSQLSRDGRVNAFDSRMRGKDGDPMDVRLWAVLIDIDGEACILSSTVNVSLEKRREAMLLSVAQGMTGETGQAFFEALTRHAALTLNADVVVVGEVLPDQRVQTLAVWRDGAPGPNFDYDPAGTPCHETLSRTDLCVHQSGLSAALPGDALRAGMDAEAYVGQSLRDQDGSTVGVLKALWRQPIVVSAEMRALMSIFSGRATAELIRLRREREIQQFNATLEQRVRQRTAELERLNAELDSFAYSVSHDLKSPLRAIDGFTRLLGEQLEGRLQPDETQLFDRVLASTRRMSTLIADMLALARVSQGQVELTRADLSELAEQVMQAEQAKHPDRPLRWRVEPGLVCVCDPRLMRIALENLLGNAVKYTRDQPAPVIAVGRVPGEAGAALAFFVRDNGVGFNMAYADKLFKPFQRLHLPSEFEGTGIGLATVRRIVERHGGTVTGTAQTGEGAEFRLTMGPARALPVPTKALR